MCTVMEMTGSMVRKRVPYENSVLCMTSASDAQIP